MAQDLTFGGVVVCDVSEGDVYRQQGERRPPRLNSRAVSFPYTAGREKQILGAQQTPGTSRRIVFDLWVFKASRAAMLAFLAALDTVQSSPAFALATVYFATPNSESAEFWTNSEMTLAFDRATIKRAAGNYCAHGVAIFEQFYGG